MSAGKVASSSRRTIDASAASAVCAPADGGYGHAQGAVSVSARMSWRYPWHDSGDQQ